MWYLVHAAVLLQDGFPCLPLDNPLDHFLGSVNSDFDKVKASLTALVIFLFMKKAFLQLSCFSQIISFAVHLRKSEQWVKFYQRLEYDSCED
jgi:hypothetical protein